jgi:hypothetical protein
MKSLDGECEDVFVEVGKENDGFVSVEDVQGGKWKVEFTCSA